MSSGNGVDLASVDAAELRRILDSLIEEAVDKITQADLTLACDILDAEPDWEDAGPLLLQTALFSLPEQEVGRPPKKRAIDRIVSKLGWRDSVARAVAVRLPSAAYSIFEIRAVEESAILLADMLDGERILRLADVDLEGVPEVGALLAGRVLDLGGRHVEIGTTLALDKSEAAALITVVASELAPAATRDSLHELVYRSRVHQRHLVVDLAEPLVLAFAESLDASDLSVAEIGAQFRHILSPPDVGPDDA